VREKYFAFRGGDPDENHLPDINIRNPTGTALPVDLIDVSIVGTLGGSKHGILQAPANRGASKIHGGKRVDDRLNEKIRKYSERVIPGGLNEQPNEKIRKYSERVIPGGLNEQPIIFKSSGFLHPKSCEFFTQCVQYASLLSKIVWHRLYAFFIKRLSVTLQRAISNGVNMRLMRLASHAGIHNNPSFQHSAVLEASI
jgi:hypothetical protein